MDREAAFRPLKSNELSVIRRLLEQPFKGREQLVSQLHGLVARTIDEDGSLELRATRGETANVKVRVPVEARTEDSDSAAVDVLLHVVDGFMNELEIYRLDSGQVAQFPDADRLRVIAY